MNLDPSLFVSPKVHERTIKLGDDSEHTLYFREITNEAFRKFQIAERSEDLDVRATAPAVLIAGSLCDKAGNPVIDMATASTLRPDVAARMTGVILDINGFGEKKGLPSAENTGSATS